MNFLLGTHEPSWLCRPEMIGVPLFVSRRRLVRACPARKAVTDWSADSGGFTELQQFGRWTVTTRQYIDEIRRFSERLGRMMWSAPMDWMCEPQMIARTGLSIDEHQHRTVANYLELVSLAPDLPFIPVLQGWAVEDYLRCMDLYASAGVNLWAGLVGVGTVCRRQGTAEGATIMRTLHGAGLQLHGFGFKTNGIAAAGQYLASTDSLAWSLNARKNPPLPECTHRSCANCIKRALWWRTSLLSAPPNKQMDLQLGAP